MARDLRKNPRREYAKTSLIKKIEAAVDLMDHIVHHRKAAAYGWSKRPYRGRKKVSGVSLNNFLLIE